MKKNWEDLKTELSSTEKNVENLPTMEQLSENAKDAVLTQRSGHPMIPKDEKIRSWEEMEGKNLTDPELTSNEASYKELKTMKEIRDDQTTQIVERLVQSAENIETTFINIVKDAAKKTEVSSLPNIAEHVELQTSTVEKSILNEAKTSSENVEIVTNDNTLKTNNNLPETKLEDKPIIPIPETLENRPLVPVFETLNGPVIPVPETNLENGPLVPVFETLATEPLPVFEKIEDEPVIPVPPTTKNSINIQSQNNMKQQLVTDNANDPDEQYNDFFTARQIAQTQGDVQDNAAKLKLESIIQGIQKKPDNETLAKQSMQVLEQFRENQEEQEETKIILSRTADSHTISKLIVEIEKKAKISLEEVLTEKIENTQNVIQEEIQFPVFDATKAIKQKEQQIVAEEQQKILEELNNSTYDREYSTRDYLSDKAKKDLTTLEIIQENLEQQKEEYVEQQTVTENLVKELTLLEKLTDILIWAKTNQVMLGLLTGTMMGAYMYYKAIAKNTGFFDTAKEVVKNIPTNTAEKLVLTEIPKKPVEDSALSVVDNFFSIMEKHKFASAISTIGTVLTAILFRGSRAAKIVFKNIIKK